MNPKNHKFEAITLGANQPPDQQVMVGSKKIGEFKAPVFEGFYAIDYKTTVPERNDLLCHPLELLPKKDEATLSYTQLRRQGNRKNRFPRSSSSYPLVPVYMEYMKQTNPATTSEDYQNLSTGEILNKAWRRHALKEMTAEAAVYRRWLPLYKEEFHEARAVWIRKSSTDQIEVGDYFSFDFDLGARVKYSKFHTIIDPFCGLTVGPNTMFDGMTIDGYASVLASQKWSFDYIYCYSMRKPGQPGYRTGMPTNEILSTPYPLP